MLGRYPRSLLHRTTSKGELHTQSHEIVHLPSSEDEKRMLQPPHQIVIGFDLGADGGRNALHTQACESPRSVLEPHHLCFRSHHQSVQSPRSPLSALGSLLSSNPHSRPCTEGPALCLKVAIEADEGGAGVNSHHAFSTKGHVANGVDNASAYAALSKSNHMADYSKAKMQGEHLTFSRPNYVGSRKNMPCNHGPSDHVHPGICANYPHSKTFLSSHCDEEDNDEATEEDVDNEDVDIPVPIFSTASPVSNYYMCDSLAVDFLSKCFLCRRHLLQGKDIYMYRGDRAFCSQECRYQQIVIDERKERRPTAVTCVSGASGHHQRLQRTTQAAIV